MQTIYATHLPLGDPPSERWHRARASVTTWIRRRFDVVVAGEDGRVVTDRATVQWSTLRSIDGSELLSVWTQQQDSVDPAWIYRTYVDIGLEADGAWLRVRVQLQSAVEGMLIRHQGATGRPGIVRDVIKDLDLTVDGQRLAQVHGVRGDAEGAVLASFLLRQSRRLPVVAVSRDKSGQYLVDPRVLHDRLLGLAHVVALDSGATFGITNALGSQLSVFSGAVRLYWPGFAADADPYLHRLYLQITLERLGQDVVIQELFERLGQLAGFSLDEPLLRRRLVAERRRREAETNAAQRAQVIARLQPEPAADATTSPEYAELFDEYEKTAQRVEELEEESLDRDEDLLKLEEERDNAEEQLQALLKAWRDEQAGKHAASPEQFEPPTGYKTIRAAVEAAEADSANLVFLDKAFDSADDSGYPYPQRVYDSLMLASEVADLWQAGELAAGPTTEFRQRTNAFRDGIGEIAESRYRNDYERTYLGEQVLLEPHIRMGRGAVRNIMRIYMYFDTDRQVIVIGHVGRKLRDNSNRN